MIDINFVPTQLRKKKKTKNTERKSIVLPSGIMLGMIGGFLGLMMLTHVGLQVFITLKSSQLKMMNKEMGEIAPSLAKSNQIVQDLRILQREFNDIKTVVHADKILWAQKLNQISNNVPRGVWLERMDLTGDNLLIKGRAVSKSNNDAQQYKFVSNIKEEESFRSHFDNIELGAIKTVQIQSLYVTDFSVIANLKK